MGQQFQNVGPWICNYEIAGGPLQEGSYKGQGKRKAEFRCGRSMRLYGFLHCMNGRLPWLAREQPTFLFMLLGWSSPSLLLWWWYWSGCWCHLGGCAGLGLCCFQALADLSFSVWCFLLFVIGWVSHASLAWLVGFHGYGTAWFVSGVTSFTSKESHDAWGGELAHECYVTPLSYDRW